MGLSFVWGLLLGLNSGWFVGFGRAFGLDGFGMWVRVGDWFG